MQEDLLYSLAYSKTGDAVFLSHLDTLRILERAIRRAGIEAAFTRGCNPHIRLSCSTAIPLGLASTGEWFSLKLERPYDPEEVRERLDRQLPGGFRIVRACRGRPPKEGGRIVLAVRCSGSGKEIASAASEFMSRDRIEVRGVRKGKAYTLDLRSFFEGFEVAGEVILFYISDLNDRRPRLGDLARACHSLASGRAIEIQEIKILRPGFSSEYHHGRGNRT